MALLPGFDDPVLDAQAAFRAVLGALAEPARLVPLPVWPKAPAPLAAGSAAVLLALADGDTPVWLDAALHMPPVAEHLRFHCGAPLTDDPAEAAFAVIADTAAMPPLAAFAQGSDDYPERSTTVILQVPALAGGPRRRMRGPGIEDTAVFAVGGLPEAFPGWLADNHARFPRGVDLLFTDGAALLGLPRTTRMEG